MTFKSGAEATISPGRPPGSRNKRTQEILDLLKSRGDKDPLDFLSEVISTGNHYSPELKVTAANYLTPYLHSKRSVAAPAPRYIDSPVQVPEFQTVDEAENFLASLPVMLGQGQIDSQSALELSTLTRAWISARHEREELQLKLAAASSTAPHQQIILQNALPTMPGHEDLIMPEINGVRGQGTELHNGHTIDHLPAIEAETVDQETNSEPQPQDPPT